MEPRQDVEVRCRFDGAWVAGFRVTEATEVGGEQRYRLLRLSDGVVLPALFALEDVRPKLARERVVPMSRAKRSARAPVGAGG